MTNDVARSLPSTPQPKRLFVPSHLDDDNDLSTIPDPRSRAMSPADGDSMGSPHQPDRDEEVTTLSTKLINAINHQTTLDDNLSAARMELEKAQDRIRQLETQVEEQREMLAGDVWVRRKTVEAEKAKLVARLVEEKRARLDMEQQKKKIEQELENLTAALFEEANKMVISAKEDARAEQEALQRKNDQLRAQLADTEGLLRSQQEQLVELKHVMEQMTLEREEALPPTVPSSPGVESFEAREPTGLVAVMRHQSLSVPLSPSYPTSFTHLLHPVLRTDLAAYNDFRELLRTTKRLSAPRLPSGSSGSGLASLGIGLGSVGSHGAGNGSTSSFATTATPPATSPQTPNTPASSVGTVSSTATPVPLPHLKETKFYKRALTEDIEPTLRLDTAPGLSWLARRSVLTSMTDGSLVVEPTPSTATGRFGRVIKPELHPCSLCGEARKEEEHLRTHRFRVSEADTTQVGYPLCKYCLGRVRSTCEFLGFLRIVKDGHWRADDEDAEKAAWEESVRLREQMFWSRIGGGVVPTGHGRHLSSSSAAPSLRGEKSPRPSHEGLQRPAEPAKQFLELPKTPDQELSEEAVLSAQLPPMASKQDTTETEAAVQQPTADSADQVSAEGPAVTKERSIVPAVDSTDQVPAEAPVAEQQTITLAVDSMDKVPAEAPVAEQQTIAPAADGPAEQQSEAESAPQPQTDTTSAPEEQPKNTNTQVPEAGDQKQVPLTAPVSITF